MTATAASRSFASLLDEVERGETVVITRGGRRIAMVGPATSGNGAALLALLALLAAGDIAFDPGYATEVAGATGAVDDQGPEWFDG